MSTFGTRVRAARVAARLTQRELADAVGLERSSVTNIEADRQDTTVSTLCALAAALGMSPGALLDEGPVGGVSPAVVARLDAAQRRLTEIVVEMRRLAREAYDVAGAVARDVRVIRGGSVGSEHFGVDGGAGGQHPDAEFPAV